MRMSRKYRSIFHTWYGDNLTAILLLFAVIDPQTKLFRQFSSSWTFSRALVLFVGIWVITIFIFVTKLYNNPNSIDPAPSQKIVAIEDILTKVESQTSEVRHFLDLLRYKIIFTLYSLHTRLLCIYCVSNCCQTKRDRLSNGDNHNFTLFQQWWW